MPCHQLLRPDPQGLIDAGYPQIPVIAISTQGLEDNPGFKVTPALLHRTVKALILGDLLMKCLYRVRPYEVEKARRTACTSSGT